MNMRQKYRQKQRGGIPEIEALIRDLQDDGAFFRTKVAFESHINHLLVIPNSIPQLFFEERRTAVVQIDETYRTNKYGAGMLHVISSTSTNITYTLAFCIYRALDK